MINRFLRRLSVRTRILGGFLILIILLTLALPLSIANYVFLVERVRQVTNVESGADRALLLASTRIAASRVNLMRYVDNQVPSPNEALDDTDTAIQLLADALQQNLITAPNQKDAVVAVMKALADYKTLITDIATARQQAGADTARTIFQAYRLGNDTGQRIEQIVKDSKDRVAAASTSVETDAQTRMWLFIASYMSVLFLGLIMALLIQRSITRPVADLHDAAEEFRAGRMDIAIAVTGTDELSVLAQTFNHLAAELSKSYVELEHRVTARTEQLRFNADVSRAAASILDADLLLREVVNLVSSRFGFYYAAVFLLDDQGQWAMLREATGEAGHALKERGHRLEVGGQSMVGTAIKTRQPRIALDVGVEAVRFANPLLPETRSEVALPLIAGQQILGALDVQSTQMAAFDEASAAALQAMADQVAIALSNTLQFQATQAALQAARQLNEASQAISQAESAAQVLAGSMEHGIITAERAYLLTYGPTDDQGNLAYYEIAASWSRRANDQLILPQTRYDPDQLPFLGLIAPGQPLLITNTQGEDVENAYQEVLQEWQAQALGGFALLAGEQAIGILLITFDTPRDFPPDEVQTITTLAQQAATVLRNRQLVEESQHTLNQLNEANQRLIGLAWQDYAAAAGGRVRKVKVGRGLSPHTPDTPLPSSVSAPVVVNGVEIGALRLEDEAADRAWTPAERALLQAVAGEVSIAVEKARLSEETEKRAQRERTLNRIAGRIRGAQTVAQVLDIAAQELNLNTSAPRTRVEITPGSTHDQAGNGSGAEK